MDSFVALLGSVWYLVLVAAISPVMILNANAAVHGQKQNHGWAFVSGAGLVLGAIGVTSFGLLGSAATDFASRQLASRTVDRVLGVLLFLFGCYLARTKWVSTASKNLESRKLLGRGPLVPTACSPGGLSEWLRISLPFRYSSRRVSASGLPICHSSSES